MKTIVQQVKVKSYSSNLDERTMGLELYDPITTFKSTRLFKGSLTPEGARFFYHTYLNQSEETIIVTWSIGEIVKLAGLDGTLYFNI